MTHVFPLNDKLFAPQSSTPLPAAHLAVLLDKPVKNHQDKGGQLKVVLNNGPLIKNMMPFHVAICAGNTKYVQMILDAANGKTAAKQDQGEGEGEPAEEDSTANPPDALAARAILSSLVSDKRCSAELAARAESFDLFKALVEDDPALLKHLNEKQIPLCYFFVERGNMAACEYLIKQSAMAWDFKHFETHMDLLQLAVIRSQNKMVHWLLDTNAAAFDVKNHKFKDGETWAGTFGMACFYCDIDVIKRLVVEFGAHENSLKEATVKTSLRRMNDAEASDAKFLADLDPEVHRVWRKYPHFPVLPADACPDKEKQARELVGEGESKTAIEPTGAATATASSSSPASYLFTGPQSRRRFKQNAPLHRAAEREVGTGEEAIEVMKYLCSIGFAVDADVPVGTTGVTPSYLAARSGKLDTLRWLHTEYKTDLNRADSVGCSGIYAVSWFNFSDVLKYLLEHKVNTSILFHGRTTPLFGAVANGATESVRILCEYGADITTPNGSQSPLERAREDGKHEIVAILEKALQERDNRR